MNPPGVESKFDNQNLIHSPAGQRTRASRQRRPAYKITTTAASTRTNRQKKSFSQDHSANPARANENNMTPVMTRPRPAALAASVGMDSGTPLPVRLGIKP